MSALFRSATLPAQGVALRACARRQLARLAIVLTCGALGGTTHVRAQDLDSTRMPPSEALDHYNKGRAHYQAGRYRQAVGELELALRLDPGSPNLVYNLARVHELLGDIEQSIGYYERYRGMLPPSETAERQRVTGAIERLRGAKQHVAKPVEEPPAPVLVPLERGVADGTFWTVATFSLGALAAGITTGALAVREERAARRFVLGSDGDDAERRGIAARADRLALASDGTLAVGAVGVLTSVLLYALRSRPAIEPGVAGTPGGFTLTLRGAL